MRSAIQTVINEGRYESFSRDQLRIALERTGALQLAFDRAIEYATTAQMALEGLPDSPSAEVLSSIPAYIVERDR
jgi:geranylgeranyl pyrophosphate synthase